MSDFDPHTWERTESERWEATSAKLIELLGLEVIPAGQSPVVEFTCPRGHGLRRWRAEIDHRDLVHLEALPGVAKKSGPITTGAHPGQGSDRRGVCAQSGCPVLVRGADYCPDHGGRAIEAISTTRTRFECPQCPWSDELRRSRLLQLYGVAVALGHDSIALSGQPATRRRR